MGIDKIKHKCYDEYSCYKKQTLKDKLNMSEKLPAKYDATTEWKNVSSERIDDVAKAQVMAEVENNSRDYIKSTGMAALRAAEAGHTMQESILMDSARRDVAYEPTRVEDAGKAYDAEKAKEENRYTPEWRNQSSERIEDSKKAAHMAAVEYAWRSVIKDKAAETRDHADKLADSTNPLKQEAINVHYIDNKYDAQVNGPKAVEEAGKAYDAYTNPTLPDSEKKAS
jgi:hypothetical protein